VFDQAGSQVVRVLPGGQQHNHRGIRVNAGKQVTAFTLAADEAVALVAFEEMRTLYFVAQPVARLCQLGFIFALHRPTFHIG
jgi:hypothetical protein